MALLGKTRFKEKELIGFYQKFKETTGGKGDLDKSNFQEFLNSMGLFPNK